MLRPGLAALPRYATEGAAGLDLTAALEQPLVIEPGGRALVPTGLAIELPARCEGQVRPRSGLAFKHGVTVLNAPGTIDEDYRGEVQVLLVNLGAEAHVIQPGDRIAQLVVAPVLQVEVIQVTDLVASNRGAGGFGSTGR
jgi:dUTP pyrophosphatase